MAQSKSDRIALFQGDITTLDVDAIVNAANRALAPGAGVCGAIHRAAGPDLAVACREVAPCPTGEARITPGFNLKASYVIHTVGPIWQGGREEEAELLAGCYRNSLDLAKAKDLTTTAFPAISTGVYGYPLAHAAQIAVETVQSWLGDNQDFEKVVFAVFDEKALMIYQCIIDG